MMGTPSFERALRNYRELVKDDSGRRLVEQDLLEKNLAPESKVAAEQALRELKEGKLR